MLGGTLVRNPVLVGGTTAFLVVLSYVSANALWYQPHAHPEPLLQTRVTVERREPLPVPTKRAAPEAKVATSPETTASVPAGEAASGDETVARVQEILASLDLYAGAIDGLDGPLTRKAIERYQTLVGMENDGVISEELLRHLNGPLPAQRTAEAVPKPAPRADAAEAREEPAAKDAIPHAEIIKVQAGLRAFGNEGIELDGIVGDRTSSAIKEFQSLFGLPVTGQPDARLLAKMTEIGLTN